MPGAAAWRAEPASPARFPRNGARRPLVGVASFHTWTPGVPLDTIPRRVCGRNLVGSWRPPRALAMASTVPAVLRFALPFRATLRCQMVAQPPRTLPLRCRSPQHRRHVAVRRAGRPRAAPFMAPASRFRRDPCALPTSSRTHSSRVSGRRNGQLLWRRLRQNPKIGPGAGRPTAGHQRCPLHGTAPLHRAIPA